MNSKNSLYLRALKNLLKERNLNILKEQENSGLYSKQEIESERINKKEKYEIEYLEDYNFNEVFPIIHEIIEKLGIVAEDLSTEEVCNLFSIKSEEFNKKFEIYIKEKEKQIKINFF